MFRKITTLTVTALALAAAGFMSIAVDGHQARAGVLPCTPGGAYRESVPFAPGGGFYLAAPNTVTSGSTPRLKFFSGGPVPPFQPNATTLFRHCDATGQDAIAFEYPAAAAGTVYALANRAGDGTAVRFEPVPASGPYLSQMWAWAAGAAPGSLVFRNLKSGRYLRIANNGFHQYGAVVAGQTARDWVQSAASIAGDAPASIVGD